MLGAQSIQLGVSNVVVCGGQESMSRVPHAILMRPGIKMGHGTLNDTMIHDGLTDAFKQYHMGITGIKNKDLYILCVLWLFFIKSVCLIF